jgi:hypothetical protein
MKSASKNARNRSNKGAQSVDPAASSAPPPTQQGQDRSGTNEDSSSNRTNARTRPEHFCEPMDTTVSVLILW